MSSQFILKYLCTKPSWLSAQKTPQPIHTEKHKCIHSLQSVSCQSSIHRNSHSGKTIQTFPVTFEIFEIQFVDFQKGQASRMCLSSILPSFIVLPVHLNWFLELHGIFTLCAEMLYALKWKQTKYSLQKYFNPFCFHINLFFLFYQLFVLHRQKHYVLFSKQWNVFNCQKWKPDARHWNVLFIFILIETCSVHLNAFYSSAWTCGLSCFMDL